MAGAAACGPGQSLRWRGSSGEGCDRAVRRCQLAAGPSRAIVRASARGTIMLHKNFIAGEWVEGTSTSRNINPSNLDDVVGEYSYADRKQAEDAIAGARAAFPGWRGSTPQVRFDALDKIGTEILARKE